MTEEVWRPFGIDSDDEVASYDALHEGVPPWMESSFWLMICQAISKKNTEPFVNLDRTLDLPVLYEMGHVLRIDMPVLSKYDVEEAFELVRSVNPLKVADYLLATEAINPIAMETLLSRCNSLYTVGIRGGKTGLVPRVLETVKVQADTVIQESVHAGKQLAKAWEALYRLEPDPSTSYRHAILAVEAVAIPIVSPKNKDATLGTVIREMNDQKSWALPMKKSPKGTESIDSVMSMLKTVWNGQHDRHAGQEDEPSAPGNVTFQEAQVAVTLAVSLVQLFHEGLVYKQLNGEPA